MIKLQMTVFLNACNFERCYQKKGMLSRLTYSFFRLYFQGYVESGRGRIRISFNIFTYEYEISIYMYFKAMNRN